MTALLTKDLAKQRCAFGQGEPCCAFLVVGPNGFECAKTGPHEATLRARLLLGRMTAKGDRCSGPPEFAPTEATP